MDLEAPLHISELNSAIAFLSLKNATTLEAGLDALR